MPHFPKPFYRKPRKRWCVEIDGEQINLGPDEAEAFRLYHEIMAARTKDDPPHSAAPVPATLTVAEVYDKFLTWCKQHREALTYKGYHEFIQGLIDHLKKNALLPAADLRPFHISEWVDSHAQWGPTRRRNAMVHVQRPFNWAYKLGYIRENPIRHLEKPQAKRRENHVTPEDFTTILGKVRDRQFRDLLTFAWESGCRPQESRLIEIRHINVGDRRVVFPPDEAKGRKRWRIIRLNDKAFAIVQRLMEGRTEGMLFLNVDGNPWKNQAIVCRFQRLKAKLGRQWAAYDFRHGFAQKMLENGVDHLAVAEIMGHVNGQMIATVYQHMNKADAHLDEALKKGSGEGSEG